MSDQTIEDHQEKEQLINYSAKKEQEIITELKGKQNQFQQPLKDAQGSRKSFGEKMNRLSTIKAYSEIMEKVTDYKDLYRKSQYYKKHFEQVAELKSEMQVYERIANIFSERQLNEIFTPLKIMDVDNNRLYYEAGYINLNDLILQRCEKKFYWFENEDQLGYIIQKVSDIIMKLSTKKIYHGDLQSSNIVIVKDHYDRAGIKLTGFGGATFDHNQLRTVTLQYFPPMDEFDATESKDNRLLAEFYSLGRIIQEICLSSIYARQDIIYQVSGQYPKFKNFRDYYFQNTQDSIYESMQLIKQYYSENIYNLLDSLLYLSSNPQDLQNTISALPKIEFLDDPENYIESVYQNNLNLYYQDVFNDLSKSTNPELQKSQFEFYLEFNLEYQGQFKTDLIFKAKYKSREKCNDYMSRKFQIINQDDSLVFIFDALYCSSLGNHIDQPSPLITLIQQFCLGGDNSYLEKAKQIINHENIDINLKNYLFKELLLNDTKDDGYDILGYCQSQEEKQQKIDKIVSIFEIHQTDEFDQLLIEGLQHFHYSSLIALKDQDKLKSYIKKLDKVVDNVLNQDTKIQCLDISLQLLQRYFKNIQMVLMPIIYKYTDEQFHAQFNSFIYKQDEIEYAKENILQNQQENLQNLQQIISDIVQDIENKLQSSDVKERTKQSVYYQLSEYYLSRGIQRDEHGSYKVKEQKSLDDGLQYIILAFDSMRDIIPSQSLKTRIYQNYYIALYGTKIEDARIVLQSAYRNRCPMPDYEAKALEGVKLHQKIQDFRQFIQKFKKYLDLDVLKDARGIVYVYSLQNYSPKEFQPGSEQNLSLLAEEEKIRINELMEKIYNESKEYEKLLRKLRRKHLQNRIQSSKVQEELGDKLKNSIDDILQLADEVEKDKNYIEIDEHGNHIKVDKIPDQLTYEQLFFFLYECSIKKSDSYNEKPKIQDVFKVIHQILDRYQTLHEFSQNDIILFRLIFEMKAIKYRERIPNDDRRHLFQYINGAKKLGNLNNQQKHTFQLLKQWNIKNYMEYKGSEDIDREDTACCTIF